MPTSASRSIWPCCIACSSARSRFGTVDASSTAMTCICSILVPLDCSATSLAALEHALALAEDNDATIDILHVVPEHDSLTASAHDARALAIDAAVARARGVLGDRVVARTAVGDPVSEI